MKRQLSRWFGKRPGTSQPTDVIPASATAPAVAAPVSQQVTATPMLPGFEQLRFLGFSNALRHFAQGTCNGFRSAGYALRPDGSVLKWESRTALVSDNQGGVFEAVRFPTRVFGGLDPIVTLTGGFNGDAYGYVLALAEDGKVWGWGKDFYEELGIEGRNYEKPVQLDPLGNVVSMVSSEDGSTRFAVSNDGKLWAWGSGYSGWLGSGTRDSRTRPAPVSGLPAIAEIVVERHGVSALAVDGTVWTWGADPAAAEDDNGALAPRQVKGVPAIARLGRGRTAIDREGSVWAWDVSLAATQVPGLAGIRDVVYDKDLRWWEEGAGPTFHAVGTGGQVWGWGANNAGQVGDGTTDEVAAPKLLDGLSNVEKILALETSRYALLADGSVRGWGAVGAVTTSSAGAEPDPGFGSSPQPLALPAVRDAAFSEKWGAVEITGLGSEGIREQVWDLREGRTMLMVCAAVGDIEELHLMLEQGANVDQADDDGDTALYYAASKGNTAAVRMLLSAGANPNGANSTVTPLRIAARSCLSNVTGQIIPPGRTHADFMHTVMALLRADADPAGIYDDNLILTRHTPQGIKVIERQHVSTYLHYNDLLLAFRDARSRLQ